MSRVSAAAIGLVAILGSAAPAAAAPNHDVALQLPRPTGPYTVGRSELYLVDHARRDPWVTGQPRRLMVSVSYPAMPGRGRPSRYATVEEARLMLARSGLTLTTPATLAATRTNSRVGARPVPGRFPLIVLSPGMGAPRFTITSLAEDLASRGYVVAAIDHAYEAAGITLPDGRTLPCVACEKVRTAADYVPLEQGRARDVSVVLDELTGPGSPWRALIDRHHIGMAGHSIGGASTVPAMLGDPRIRAGLDLDGALHVPVPPARLGGRPFLLLGTFEHAPGGTLDPTWDASWPNLDGWKRWLTVAGAEHLSFTDFPALAAQLGQPDPLPAERAVAITREYVGAFFDEHLRGRPQPVLDGPTTCNPEVSFQRP